MFSWILVLGTAVTPLLPVTHTEATVASSSIQSSRSVKASLVFTSHASLPMIRYNLMSVTFPPHMAISHARKKEDGFYFHQEESGLVAWQHLLLFTCTAQSHQTQSTETPTYLQFFIYIAQWCWPCQEHREMMCCSCWFHILFSFAHV